MRVRYSFSSRKTGHLENIKKQRVKFPNVMKEVIEISDIILHVIDARFISEMRNKTIEKLIKKKKSKSIFVLNKCDLVDIESIKKDLPSDLRPFVFVSVKDGTGISELRNRIKIEAKRIELPEEKTRVQVGIIGYPNAGKSSLINKLARRGVASTSKQAGHTKGMQKIRFSENILMLDTPGVIPDERYSSEKMNKISQDTKLGSRTYSSVKNPEDIVAYIMTPPNPMEKENPTEEERKLTKEAEMNAKKIEEFYKINAKGNSEVLIENLGRVKNYLKKGGVVDTDRTARVILKDWQEGKIK